VIVSDTTPLSNFIQLGLVNLLHQMFSKITIPESVAQELEEGSDFLGDWRYVARGLIDVVAVEQDALREQQLLGLHPGEAEAIALALHHNANLLLCDDLAGERVVEMPAA